MTVLTAGAPVTLRRGHLSAWVLGAVGVVVLLVTAGLFAVTPLEGTAGFVIVAAALFLAAQGVVSTVVEGRRRAIDRTVTSAVVFAFLLALVPLVSVLTYALRQGAHRFDVEFFTHSLRNIGARDAGGGAYHALIGTLQQVLITTVISVPFGLLVAVYIVEYGRGRLAAAIRFFVDVMTGIPSIVAGLFVLSFWTLGLGQGFSGFAASLALTVLMLPVVVRASEEMLKLVPDSLREASFALGVPRWKTILRIVLPTALPGIVTGVMLAIARVTGETAPVLLTAFGAASINTDPFHGPQSSLPLLVFQQAQDAQQTAVNRAWTAALTLILVVMVLNLVARLLTRRNRLER
ncbi:MAG: phosphate transporter, inner rane subunit PstA [Frankiales bacterium]|nr:phosphate transporter, inner rane subunit PstA [Frankiales bacterium]